tara:strand:- start:152 stop:484 length:333 start_codon:yes stop_codon:yes gene_type:complete
MVCTLSTIGGLIIWPGSIYLALAFMGWLGYNQQRKIYSLIDSFNNYTDELMPIMKFRNIKPLHKNIKNIFINILVFPFRFLFGLVLGGALLVLTYYVYLGLAMCYPFFNG